MPPLPLPPLEKTVERYLETVRHLALDDSEYDATERAANELLHSAAGAELHRRVEAVARTGGEGGAYPYSYIEGWWDEMYQAGRWQAVVNSNPFYIINAPSAPQPDQAASFSHALFGWWQDVLAGKLPQDKDPRGNPMCMFQYSRVLGATQIPRPQRDHIHLAPEAQHIVVLHCHKYYRVDMGGASKGSIADAMRRILAGGRGSPSEDVGIFTSSDRDLWAKTRKHMEADPAIAASLKDIDDALFVVVLDDGEGTSLDERAKMMLHGDACKKRWFDKHQVIVAADGTLGMNFNHCATDGLTWNAMIGQVLERASSSPSDASSNAAPVRQINIAAPSALSGELARAQEEAAALTENTHTSTLKFDVYGKKAIKSMGVSPDALLQMAFQVAYAKLHPHSPLPLRTKRAR